MRTATILLFCAVVLAAVCTTYADDTTDEADATAEIANMVGTEIDTEEKSNKGKWGKGGRKSFLKKLAAKMKGKGDASKFQSKGGKKAFESFMAKMKGAEGGDSKMKDGLKSFFQNKMGKGASGAGGAGGGKGDMMNKIQSFFGSKDE